MKSKDITLIVVIGIISAVFSVILANIIISPAERDQTVEVVEPITANFERPPVQYFNVNSINPTQEIRIQQDEGSNPFAAN